MNSPKKIAFWGTPEFTVDFLEVLKKHNMVPSLIITNPDRPQGRGMVMTAPAPKVWAQENNIPFIQPEKITEEVFTTRATQNWDLFIVIAYGKILPEKVITLPTYGTINVHYSLLPKYRGATPVESALLNGDTTTGVSIQQMRFKLDSGPVIAEKIIAIQDNDTTQTLRAKLNSEAVQILPSVIENIFTHAISPKEQPEVDMLPCKKISKADGEITLSDDPILLDRKYRAYFGWPGIYFYTEKDGQKMRVKITKAHYEKENNSFVIEEVIPENHKRISYDTFLKSF